MSGRVTGENSPVLTGPSPYRARSSGCRRLLRRLDFADNFVTFSVTTGPPFEFPTSVRWRTFVLVEGMRDSACGEAWSRRALVSSRLVERQVRRSPGGAHGRIG